MANRSSLVCQRLTHHLRARHHESRDKFSVHLTIGHGHLRELESLIRRIEQPVYKRRWDEQWKVGNRWQSGQPAYDAEFIEALIGGSQKRPNGGWRKRRPAVLLRWMIGQPHCSKTRASPPPGLL